MKRNYGVRYSEIAHLICSKYMERLNMSLSAFVEALCTTECLKYDNKFTEDELDELWDDFSPSRRSKVGDKFRKRHKALPTFVKREILRNIYEFSLMEDVDMNAFDNANFHIWINDKSEYMFYYAVGCVNKRSLDEYVNSLGITVETLGKTGRASNEYVYLGRHERFMEGRQGSELFRYLCMYMQVPYCDCIRLHYSELPRLVNAVRMLDGLAETVGNEAASRCASREPRSLCERGSREHCCV